MKKIKNLVLAILCLNIVLTNPIKPMIKNKEILEEKKRNKLFEKTLEKTLKFLANKSFGEPILSELAAYLNESHDTNILIYEGIDVLTKVKATRQTEEDMRAFLNKYSLYNYNIFKLPTNRQSKSNLMNQYEKADADNTKIFYENLLKFILQFKKTLKKQKDKKLIFIYSYPTFFAAVLLLLHLSIEEDNIFLQQ